jgi:hypothetical protein
VHYIGDVNYYLGKPSLFDYYATSLHPGVSAAAGGHRRRYRQQQSIIVQRPGGNGIGKDSKARSHFPTAHQRHHQHPADPDGVYCR